MILYQVHHMWYDTSMIDECWHSILQAFETKLQTIFKKTARFPYKEEKFAKRTL